jgi:hypothetical protein
MARRTKARGLPHEPRNAEPFCPCRDFKLYKAIRANAALHPGAKIVWQALVEKTYAPNTYVEIAWKTLAKDVGLHPDQTKRHAYKLRDAGLIRIIKQCKDGHQKSNRFEFLKRDLEEIQSGTLGLQQRRQGGSRVRSGGELICAGSGAY